ncbi:periplasmic binding protein-like I [Gaertneriomyces semiglobifer]|nr:periplasmic binding protein-like I [Gaertneriomyces semiglobifer]
MSRIFEVCTVLVVVWMVYLRGALSAVTTVRIGLSLPFEGANSGWTDGARDTMNLRLQMMKDCEHTNPYCYPLHPDLDIQLVPLANPTLTLVEAGQNDPTLASSIQSALTANANGYDALVGAGWSDATKGLAGTAGSLGKWVCDGSSTATELSNKVDYPTFFRTTPDDSFGAQAIIGAIHASGWNRVAVIASTDSFGTGLLAGARQAAAGLDVKIVLERTFVPGTTDFTSTVAALRTSGATVFAFLGVAADMIPLLNEADKQGLVTPGYQFVTTGDALYVTSILQSQDASYTPDALEQLARWNGVWSVSAMEGNGPIYDEFLELYQAFRNDLTAAPDVYISFFGTCIEMYALAFSKALHDGTPFTSLTLSDFSFPNNIGITGYLSLDANGDRVGAYEVQFFNSSSGIAGEFVKLATWDPASTFAESSSSFGGGFTAVPGQQMVYLGGVTTKPADTLQIIETLEIVRWGSGLGILAIILCAISAVVLVGLMGIVGSARNNPIFKATSPLFLVFTLLGTLVGSVYPLTLIGVPTKAACIASAWLVPCALGLVLGSLLVKTLRLFYIFRQQGARKLGFSDKHMFMWLCGILGVYLVIVLVWTAVDAPHPVKHIYQYTSTTSITTQAFCSSTYQWGFFGTLIAYTVILLVISGFMAFVTRKLPRQFSEAKSLGYIIYAGSAILVFVVPILYLLDLSYGGYVLIKIFATYAAVIVTVAVLFGDKCYRLWQERQARSHTDLLKGGGLAKKSTKDETTDSYMIKTVVKSATKSGTVWVLNKQSMVSYWAERTILLFADKHILLITGGSQEKSATSGTACQVFALQHYEVHTSSDEQSGIYSIKLVNPKHSRLSIVFRVESSEVLEDWVVILGKLCLHGSQKGATSRNGRPSVDFSSTNNRKTVMATTGVMKTTRLEEELEPV